MDYDEPEEELENTKLQDCLIQFENTSRVVILEVNSFLKNVLNYEQ